MMTRHDDEPLSTDETATQKQPSPRALRIASIALVAVMIIMSVALWLLTSMNQQDPIQRGTGNAGAVSTEQLLDNLVSDLRTNGAMMSDTELEIAVRAWLDEQATPTTVLASEQASRGLVEAPAETS